MAGLQTPATGIAFVIINLYGHGFRVSCQGLTRTGEDTVRIAFAEHTGKGFEFSAVCFQYPNPGHPWVKYTFLGA
jgi:hypothetical protein